MLDQLECAQGKKVSKKLTGLTLSLSGKVEKLALEQVVSGHVSLSSRAWLCPSDRAVTVPEQAPGSLSLTCMPLAKASRDNCPHSRGAQTPLCLADSHPVLAEL